MKWVCPIIILFLLISCKSRNQSGAKGKRVDLNPYYDNVAKLTDTLIITQYTCRDCQYEILTDLKIEDSLNLIRFYKIISSEQKTTYTKEIQIEKKLLMIPVKTGTTNFRLYRYYENEIFPKDTSWYYLIVQK